MSYNLNGFAGAENDHQAQAEAQDDHGPAFDHSDIEVASLDGTNFSGFSTADFDDTPYNVNDDTSYFDEDSIDGEEDFAEPELNADGGENNSTANHEEPKEKTATGLMLYEKRKPCVKAMGKVRTDDNGLLEWLHPLTGQWCPAVYHEQIREYLITEAAKLGAYRFPMARGKRPLDVTAFHPAFRNNGAKRDNWPKILFQYLPFYSDLSHVKPEFWQLHDGRFVIDLNNDGMHDYPHMPATLARKADAWLLLALMRMNCTISIQDLRGRMPGGMDRSRTDPMGRNRISMNMQRFRKFACCLTWTSMQHSNVQRDYLDQKLPRRCLRENTTKTFRILYQHEAAELDLVDAGKFLHRTRAKERDLSEAKSKAVYAKKLEEYRDQKRRFDKKYPDGGPKDYDTEDEVFRVTFGNQQEPEQGLPPVEDSEEEAPRRAAETQVGPPTLSSKRLFVLPDHEATLWNEDVVCPRYHRNYAGFLTTGPNNLTRAQLIYDLLQPTREHFRSCTGSYPPKTAGDECYTCQHGDIQDALNEFHVRAHGPHLSYVQVVKLIGILWLDREVLYWNNNWDEAWFGPRLVFSKDTLAQEQHDGVTT
ncbi:MAG: hypothetical protein Q9196_006787, partial [Gyalolechia fulgens]